MSWWDDLPSERQELIETVLGSAPRQLEVLKLRMEGHSTLEISRALKIAEPTVRMHLERALLKMAPHIQRKDAA